MAGRTDGLIKTFRAAGPVAPRRIVKLGAADDLVLAAAAAGDASIGVSQELGADAGEPLDVALDGIGEVTLGGNVERGDQLTSDAEGRAITAAPAAGVAVRTIGTALASGVAGDIAPLIIERGVVRG